MSQNFPLAAMKLLVDDIENVGLTGEDCVELGLLGAFLIEIKLWQCCIAVDGDVIGPEAHNIAVLPVDL